MDTTDITPQIMAAIREDIREFRASVDQRFASVDQRFDAVDQRFDAVDHRLGAVEHRLGAVEHRLDAVEGRLGVVETSIVALQQVVTVDLAASTAQLTAINVTMIDMMAMHQRHSDAQQQLGLRLSKCELDIAELKSRTP